MLKRNSISFAVTAAVALMVSTIVQAQEESDAKSKPIVTVAFSGYDNLVSDLNFVGDLAGNPQLGSALEMTTMLATGGQELKSLDKSKPWGAVLVADEAGIRGLGFVPFSDLDELKTILETNDVKFSEEDDCLVVPMNGQSVYLKGEGGWLFFSGQSANLKNLPKDPAKTLGGLQDSYNLAVRVDVKNIPEMLRGMLLDGLQLGLQAGMAQMPGETDEQYALRSKMAEQSLEQLKTAVNELDAIQLGLAIDEEVPSIYLDVEVTAQPDTETARRITAAKGMATRFGGFVVPDAVLSYNGVTRLVDAQVDQFKVMIEGFHGKVKKELEEQELPEDIAKTSNELVDDAFAILTSTVKEGELDLGMFLQADGEKATWLGGIRVADGNKIEDVLKVVVDEAAKEMPPLKEGVQFDAAEHAGVRLHTLTIPSEALGAPQLAELFGDELVIVVGTADKAVYLSVGTDSMELLKKAIDDSKTAKDLPPASLTISIGAIAKLLGKYVPDPQVQNAVGLITAKLADSKGKDRITLTTTISDNSLKNRLEIEEDLLKVLGVIPAIVMAAGQMGG